MDNFSYYEGQIEVEVNNNILILIGIGLVFIGIIVLIIASMFNLFGSKASKQADSKIESKVAIVVFLGPIPFGFGNDKKLVIGLLIVGTILLVLWWIFSKGN